MGWTIASTVFTVISIICSIISFRNAKKARQYKDEVVVFNDTIEIKGVLETFKEVRLKFIQETRTDDWYKGKDVNPVISPLEGVLAKIAVVYPIMEDPSVLKEKVKAVSTEIVRFDNSAKSAKK